MWWGISLLHQGRWSKSYSLHWLLRILLHHWVSVIFCLGWVLCSILGWLPSLNSENLGRCEGCHRVCRDMWGKNPIQLAGWQGLSPVGLPLPGSVFSICSLYSKGTLHLLCYTGWMLGSVWMVYVTGMLLMVSKEVGKAFISDTMSWAATVVGGVMLWSCEGAIFVLWPCEGVIFKAGLGCFCYMFCRGLMAGCYDIE